MSMLAIQYPRHRCSDNEFRITRETEILPTEHGVAMLQPPTVCHLLGRPSRS